MMNAIKKQRSFIIGDKWLYYKIYTGNKTSDLILIEVIKPMIEKLLKKDIIKKWFFIRYSDPEHHLRIRFFYEGKDKIGEIINIFNKELNWFIENDLIWKVQIDTYQRELERYGVNSITYSEDYFFLDSTMIIELLNLIEGDEGEEIRWLFGLKAIDSLLNAFNYDDESKLNLLEKLKISFGNEFNMSRQLKKQLDIKFRKENNKIIDFLNPESQLKQLYSPLYEIIRKKELLTKEIAEKIFFLKRKNKLELEVDYLMSSYIHMLMNRLFKSNNRLHEMVIYDFLFRIYKSKCARKRQASKENNN